MTSESRPYQPHPAPVAMSQIEREDALTFEPESPQEITYMEALLEGANPDEGFYE